MTYQKLISEPMPTYSRGEEIFNLVTHIVGGGIGVVILIMSVIVSAIKQYSGLEIFSLIIYGISNIFLYTISSVYHGLKPGRVSKRVLRILDHCTIYVLIAGTYTPLCFISLHLNSVGIAILLIEWVGAAIGITLNALDMNNKFVKIISMFLYIVMGWALAFFPSAISSITILDFIFILAGGVVYTLGVIFYSVGAKKKWFHSIFHIFCVVATILQFLGITFMIFGI